MDETELKFLNGHVSIPGSLERQFSGAMKLPRFRMAEVLSVHLGLPSEDAPGVVCDFLETLLYVLGNAARQNPPKVEHRGPDIAAEALTDCDVDECIALARHFGWATVPLSGGAVGTIDMRLRALLASILGAHIDSALKQWKKNDWIGYKATI